VIAARSVLQSRDHRTSSRRILSVLKRRERIQSNWTQHGLSRLTAISDAGSTPAASTNLREAKAFAPACRARHFTPELQRRPKRKRMREPWRRRNHRQRTLRRLSMLSGVNIHAHRYRHTFATQLLSKGVPVSEVAAILGNSARIVEKHYS
jgi:integrase